MRSSAWRWNSSIRERQKHRSSCSLPCVYSCQECEVMRERHSLRRQRVPPHIHTLQSRHQRQLLHRQFWERDMKRETVCAASALQVQRHTVLTNVYFIKKNTLQNKAIHRDQIQTLWSISHKLKHALHIFFSLKCFKPVETNSTDQIRWQHQFLH